MQAHESFCFWSFNYVCLLYTHTQRFATILLYMNIMNFRNSTVYCNIRVLQLQFSGKLWHVGGFRCWCSCSYSFINSRLLVSTYSTSCLLFFCSHERRNRCSKEKHGSWPAMWRKNLLFVLGGEIDPTLFKDDGQSNAASLRIIQIYHLLHNLSSILKNNLWFLGIWIWPLLQCALRLFLNHCGLLRARAAK